MKIRAQLEKSKQAAQNLAELSAQKKNMLLQTLAHNLQAASAKVLEANAKDLAAMSTADPMYDRLLLNQDRINSMIRDIETVIALATPLGKILEDKKLPNGLEITRISVPLGVVAVIYESRPNVTIDVFTLCFKSGNACVLKGGKEAHYTNQSLVAIIAQALKEHHIDSDIIYLLPVEREASLELLHATGLVDVCIPRGSQALIDFVRNNAKIPVIETGAGIVHTYFDQSGDLAQGSLIIENSKTRRVSVCNALDCLIVHRERLSDLFALFEPLIKHSVELYCDPESYAALSAYPQGLLQHAQAEDYGREFLAYKLAIKTVANVQEAVSHIQQYSSGHSEAIISKDQFAIDYFLNRIDAAAIYVNASTAFTDGAQFGMGAEIGISTQKLHARGPMGLDALTSYKWLIRGNGNLRP